MTDIVIPWGWGRWKAPKMVAGCLLGGMFFVDWWGVKILVGSRWGAQEDLGGIFAHFKFQLNFNFSVFFNHFLPFNGYFIVDIMSGTDYFIKFSVLMVQKW